MNCQLPMSDCSFKWPLKEHMIIGKKTPDYKKRRAKKRKTIEKEFNSQAQKNVHVIIVGN